MLSSVFLSDPNGNHWAIPGAESFSEDFDIDSQLVYCRGLAHSLAIKSRSRKCQLVTYSPPELPTPKKTYCLTLETTRHGLRSLVIYPVCRYSIMEDPHTTVSDTITSTKTSVEFFPFEISFNNTYTSKIEIRERLSGTSNYNRLRETLYRQNGTVLHLLELLTSGQVETRTFRVVYNQGGVWEMSGPSDLMSEEAGVWTVDDIEATTASNGVFEMYDNYDKETLWRP